MTDQQISGLEPSGREPEVQAYLRRCFRRRLVHRAGKLVLLAVFEMFAVPFALLTFVALVLPGLWADHGKLLAILIVAACAAWMGATGLRWLREVRRTFEIPRAASPEMAVRRFVDELLGPGPANSYAAWRLLDDEASGPIENFERLEQAARAWADQVKRSHEMPGALMGIDDVSTMPLEASDPSRARVIVRLDFARRIEPEADDDIHTEQLAFDVRGEDGIWLITSIRGGLAEHLRKKN